jgi:uncharacterized protein YigE (DUF2233 family)
MWRVLIFCGLCCASKAFELSAPTFEGVRFTVCKVDLRKDKLELFLTATDGRPYANFDRLVALRSADFARLGFAMNAGMFEPGYQPTGLFIADGREQSAINLKPGKGNFYLKPNGVFAIAQGSFVLVNSQQWSAVAGPIQLATQSGPMLVENGTIHPAFSVKSTSRYVRNAVGVLSDKEAFLVISDRPITFYHLARFMKVGLGCENALYLDGAISSIYAPALSRNDAKYSLGPIIGVMEAPVAE